MQKTKNLVNLLKNKLSIQVGSILIYDGECIFCKKYVNYYRMNKAVGKLHLIDARNFSYIVKQLALYNFNINDGMVLIHGEIIYHGADAAHALALMSTQNGFFNKINAGVFKHKYLAKSIYPFLKLGRRVTLFIRKKSSKI